MADTFKEFKGKLIKKINESKRADGLDTILRKAHCFNWNNFIRNKQR